MCKRGYCQKKKMSVDIRTSVLNEDYYARRNAPTYKQFIGKYHFIDDMGRQYMIAKKNKQVFQNERLQYKPRDTTKKPHQCVTNSNGYVNLYVKLPDNHVKWFGSRDNDRIIKLTSIKDKSTHLPILKSTGKADPRSSTGPIYVKGLSVAMCESLLNK